MTIYKTIQKYTFAAVLIGLVTLVGVPVTHASIATDTAAALVNHPDGGAGLELAIADILDGYQGEPHLIVREILRAAACASDEEGEPDAIVAEIPRAAACASDEQLVAIGRALATKARLLAATDAEQYRAVTAVVLATRNPQILTVFKAVGSNRPASLIVPTGSGGGGLDTTSPN